MFKTRKLFVAMLAVMLVVAMLLTGCGKPAAEAPAEPAPAEEPAAEEPATEEPATEEPAEPEAPAEPVYDEVTLRMASGSGSATAPAQRMVEFTETVKERSGGKVVIEWYPDSQLYGTQHLAEATMSGAIDMMLNGTATAWSDYCPVFNYTESWFLWSGREHIVAHLDEYRELLFPLWEEIGVKPLCFVDTGEGGFISQVPIHGPEDINGIQMCGPSQPDWSAIEALGGTAVQIAAAERYDALAKGAVDALRLVYTGITRFSLQDQCEYFVPSTTITLHCVLMNQDSWDALNADTQNLIMECASEIEAYSFEAMPAVEAENLATIEAACETYYLTPEDIKAFQTALEPYYEGILQSCEDAGYGDQARRFLEIAAS